MTSGSTYVRKIGDSQFEYGFIRRSTNFRKRPDVYTPAGIEPSVVAAELCRSQLSTLPATSE